MKNERIYDGSIVTKVKLMKIKNPMLVVTDIDKFVNACIYVKFQFVTAFLNFGKEILEGKMK